MLARWCACTHGVLEMEGRWYGESQGKRGELEATWGHLEASGDGEEPRMAFDTAGRTRHLTLKGFSSGRDPSRGESQSSAGGSPERAGWGTGFAPVVGRQGAQSYQGPVLP